MTNKSLGQIAHDEGRKQGGWARYWSDMGAGHQQEWEAIADDVADVVRQQTATECAKICKELPVPPDCYDGVTWDCATLACEAAIKERFGRFGLIELESTK